MIKLNGQKKKIYMEKFIILINIVFIFSEILMENFVM